jgi:hypothetical protein
MNKASVNDRYLVVRPLAFALLCSAERSYSWRRRLRSCRERTTRRRNRCTSEDCRRRWSRRRSISVCFGHYRTSELKTKSLFLYFFFLQCTTTCPIRQPASLPLCRRRNPSLRSPTRPKSATPSGRPMARTTTIPMPSSARPAILTPVLSLLPILCHPTPSQTPVLSSTPSSAAPKTPSPARNRSLLTQEASVLYSSHSPISSSTPVSLPLLKIGGLTVSLLISISAFFMAAVINRSTASARRTAPADCGRTCSLMEGCFSCLRLHALCLFYCAATITCVLVPKVRCSAHSIFASTLQTRSSSSTSLARTKPQSPSQVPNALNKTMRSSREPVSSTAVILCRSSFEVSSSVNKPSWFSDICYRLRWCNPWSDARRLRLAS